MKNHHVCPGEVVGFLKFFFVLVENEKQSGAHMMVSVVQAIITPHPKKNKNKNYTFFYFKRKRSTTKMIV